MRQLLLSTLCLALVHGLTAQQPVPDSRQASAAQANAKAEQIQRAEDLLERGDYHAAEPVLKALAQTNPNDGHILFDLGFTQEQNGETAAALTSYQAAVQADATLAEPRVALGLLQARTGEAEAAIASLQAATQLAGVPPALKARAFRALARLWEAQHPDQARTALADAIQLTGEQPGDAELTAALATAAGNSAGAEATYRRVLAQNPGNVAATVELASLLQKTNRLAEADALLAPSLAAHPGDPRLTAQMATLDAAEDKTAEALTLLRSLRDTDASTLSNPNLTRLYAHLLLVSGDAAAAEPLYEQLVRAQPADPTLLDDLGSTLVRGGKFAEAETVLATAVARREAFHNDAAWGDTAGHLAFAASRNHQPRVVLQALEARATVLPNSPATLFLGATSYDALHENKEAVRAYRAFLAATDGKLPDEEFEARHRLIALEHEH